MEEEKRKIYTVVAVVVGLGLVFSCILGALAGGAAGYLAGRRQAEQVALQVVERELATRPEIFAPVPEPPAPAPVPAIAGALIVQVIPHSPAEQAGLQGGDIILAVDRTPINTAHPLDKVIADYKPGDMVTIRFWRAGREDSVRVTLAEQPRQAGSPYLGIRFRMLTGD